MDCPNECYDICLYLILLACYIIMVVSFYMTIRNLKKIIDMKTDIIEKLFNHIDCLKEKNNKKR